MDSKPRASTAVILAVLGIIALSGTAHAQAVRGKVLASSSGTPVVGAEVALVDTAGSLLTSGLTDASGTFGLSAPEPGTFRIRVERIGYRAWASQRFTLHAGDVHSLRAEVPVETVELGDITVVAEKRCRSWSQRGTGVDRLWRETRKALRRSAMRPAGADARYEVRNFRRVVGERGRIEDERDTTRVGTARITGPYRSLSPDSLARAGYVVEDEEARVYYAPDAQALLSDAFRRSHCFRLRRHGGRDGWIGLAFRPVEGRSRPDIRGVLWLDRATAELRRLEYLYTSLDIPTGQEGAGGSIRFRRLPSGQWIVERWTIRMPRVRLDRRHRRMLAGYTIVGGEVSALVDPSGERVVLARRSSVAGDVTTSSGRPLAGADVRLRGTDRSTSTNGAGRFRFDLVPEGRYSLEVDPPLLSTLGGSGVSRVVDLEGEATRQLRVEVPLQELVARAACGEPGVRDDTPAEPGVVVYGHVRGPRRELLADVPVGASWRMGGEGGTGAPVTVRTRTNQKGAFALCGLPADEEVVLMGQPPGLEPAVDTLAPDRPKLTRAALEASTSVETTARGTSEEDSEADEGDAGLSGRVVAADGSRPLEGARVSVAGHTVLTDSVGRFRMDNLPAGAVRVTVEYLGRTSRERALHLEDDQVVHPTLRIQTNPVSVADLEVEVEGTEVSAKLRGFWKRKRRGRGLYLTRQQIEDRPGTNLSDALRGVLGLSLRRCPPPSPPGCYRLGSPTRTSGFLAQDCSPTYWVDGGRRRLGPRQGIDDLVGSKEDVTAVEFYRGPGEMPPQFSGVAGGCGALVVWTR